MNQKKLVYYFLVISISLILVLPLLNLSFIYQNGKINLQSFSKRQLFSTDYLESIENYLVYKIFNISLNEPQVVAGKDDFLFLGNSYGGVIDKAKGMFPYTDKEIDTWTMKLKKLQDWYEVQGIQFIIAVASNKHTVYNDKLPDNILYKEGKTITDDIMRYSLKKNIHILNLKKALREKKKDQQLFFHTDTHWNNYGALIGYMNTMKYLNTIYRQDYKIAEYETIETGTNFGGGDLTNLLKINYFLSNNAEKDYHIPFMRESEVCYGEITTDNKLKKCTPGIKNTFNQYSINKNALNKEKLLYICDSFGLANSQRYQETFNTVWRFHLGYKNGGVGALLDFMEENRPDIVIYQIVERDLYNNYIIAGIPSKKISE